MADLREIPNLIGANGKIIVRAQCGGFNCRKIFEVQNPVYPLPDTLICPDCEARFNEGIVRFVHANSGRTKGGFHLTDGYSE